MDHRILIGTLTETYVDALIVAGVHIDLPAGISVELFPIGTSLRVAYTLEGDKRIAAHIRRSTDQKDVEIACRVLTEHAHHELPDVHVRPVALRDLGDP